MLNQYASRCSFFPLKLSVLPTDSITLRVGSINLWCARLHDGVMLRDLSKRSYGSDQTRRLPALAIGTTSDVASASDRDRIIDCGAIKPDVNRDGRRLAVASGISEAFIKGAKQLMRGSPISPGSGKHIV
jgi:hypothetical protein